MVGDTGFEPVTSSVSRKRATTALIARGRAVRLPRWRRDLNPCTRLCRPLPRLSATPPRRRLSLRADNRARTGDLNLGKVALYQLSYVRANTSGVTSPLDACQTLADDFADDKTEVSACPTDGYLRRRRRVNCCSSAASSRRRSPSSSLLSSSLGATCPGPGSSLPRRTPVPRAFAALIKRVVGR